MNDPADIGRRVLEALARGRALQLERRQRRAVELADLVFRAARLDRAAGRPERGRPVRIARRLQLDGWPVSERWVRSLIRNRGSDSAALPATAMVKCA
jgi:hypothetical protein